MAGRGVAEDVHHRPHRVPGIPQQVGGARRACKVDNPLEVGSATGGELARQVLPRDPQRRGDMAGLRGEGDPAEYLVPGGELQAVGEASQAASRGPSSGRTADNTNIGIRGNRPGSASAAAGAVFTSSTTASTRR